jgi:hypothetical protein
MALPRLLQFPNPVNDNAARTVAAGVVVMSVLFLATGWTWVLIPLTYGFIARVASGPRFSPLGLLATKVIVPGLKFPYKPMSGPPKRFAQAMGVAFSGSASIVAFGFGQIGAAQAIIAVLAVCALLESALGYCLGCKTFALLARAGLVPEAICEECADISGRLRANTAV